MPVESPAAARTPGDIDSGRGWVVVAATFLSTFTGFGLVYSFGTFFDSMAVEFGSGRGATALMFSITTTIYFGLGMYAGKLGDRYGPRPLLVVSAVCVAVGMITTSMVHTIWLGYLTYGLGLGIAVACAYVPMVAFVGGWFFKHRAAALGVAVSGIGVGTLVTAPIAQSLIARYGWRQAFVILGIVGAVILLIAAVLAKRPPAHDTDEPARPLRETIRDRDFVAMYLSGFFIGIALFVPFVFIKNYAVGEGISPGKAATLVGLIGAASVVGRLGIGSLGTRIKALRLLQFSFVLMTVSYLLWLFAGSSFTTLVLFTIVLGIGYGGYIALMPAVMASIFGPVGLGATLGALYTSAAFGGLIGPASVGALIDATSYSWGILTSMVITGVASVFLFALNKTRAHDR